MAKRPVQCKNLQHDLPTDLLVLSVLTNAKLTPVFWNGISDSQRAEPTASAAANEDPSSTLDDLEDLDEVENVLTTKAGRRSTVTSGLSASTLRMNASWSSTCSDHVRSLASYLHIMVLISYIGTG